MFYEIDRSYLNTSPKDTLIYTAYPELSFRDIPRAKVGSKPTLKLEGRKFGFTTSIYLSSNNDIFSDSLTSFENFNGIKLEQTEYIIQNSNVIYVMCRELLSEGLMCVIIENPSGFVITKDIIVVD